MAGEIEEPFSLRFQADSLHSGSISFGRFETESLSWERRSSFSHNRYLEEVEKYSKPGSVTEKAAYFEAHFKKKPLLYPSSLDCQNRTAYETSENGPFENKSYGDDFKSSAEYQNKTCYQDTENDACDGTEYGYDFQHVYEASHLTCFDRSPYGSEYDGGHGFKESEREDNLYSQPHVVHAHDSAAMGTVPEDITEEKHESQTKESLLINNVTKAEVKERINGTSLAASDGVNAASVEHQKPPKVKTALETKFRNPRLKSLVNITQTPRNTTCEASKEFSKMPGRKERDAIVIMRKEKHLSRSTAPTTTAILNKTEEIVKLNGSKAKVILENRSTRKDMKAKKVVDSQSSVSERSAGGTHQTSNRLKQSLSSTKQTMKQSAAGFSFKNEICAEKRKEFNMKLEEKMHAREAQMNQIQAKTLENTQAEIKQFRKSLKFKATPMPSFYNKAGRGWSDKSKVVSNNTKTVKLQRPSTSSRAGASERSSSCPKGGNGDALSATEPAKTTDSSEDLGVNN